MNLSLRAKSALALLSCIILVLIVALVAGWWALRGVEESLGTAYARNVTQYNKQRILAPVMRELALSQRLADSEVTRQFLRNENNPAFKTLFFAEAERYRSAFDDHSYFLIAATTRNYYFNDPKSKPSNRPRYVLKKNDPADAWFFNSLKNTVDFNINVDPDTKLKLTKVWFNVMVKDGAKKVGIAGTGLDLTSFLNRFITSSEGGVTPIIVNQSGAIQAHPNRKLIDYSSVNDKGADHSTIFRLLGLKEDQAEMKAAMQRAKQNDEHIQIFQGEINQARQLFAVTYIPELKWYVVTAVDLNAARVLDNRLLLPFLLGGSILLVALLLASVVAVNRIVLAPLSKLTQSARTMAAGNYDAELPPVTNDELGELTRAFGAMASQVAAHTDELESKVQARTSELVAVNKQVSDSIQYASLIQNAILPDQELARALHHQYFVLWRPRDVVGGDFYIFRSDDNGCLLGVVDCAGHGVPGAFMTMIAHAALNVALETLPLSDPATLLKEMDTRIRAHLQNDPAHAQVATHMDVGLAYANFAENTVVFAGAKVSLYWSDGEEIGEVQGDRTVIAGKRTSDFSNRSTPLHPSCTFYLTTDGLLDQAGGEKGFSFGEERFKSLLKRTAGRPLAEQRAAFIEELATYQGALPQRDDITVLCFRFEK